MKSKLLIIIIFLVVTVCVQAQMPMPKWQEQLESINKRRAIRDLSVQDYIYMGKAMTEADIETLKKSFLSGDNYMPFYTEEVLSFKKMKEKEAGLLINYREYISNFFDDKVRPGVEVVKIVWKYGELTFPGLCLVTEEGYLLDHVMLNIMIVRDRRKTTRTTLNVTLPQLKQIMVNFFCEVLTQNYGMADGHSIETMMNALQHYEGQYVVDLNKVKLRAINDALFKSPLTDYFYERSQQNFDSTLIGGKGSFSSLFTSEKYLIKENKETYYQKELQVSVHPFLKYICKSYELDGNEPISFFWDKIKADYYGCLYDFEVNEDIKMFLTLYFWPYLCYCANIDFRTGEDKTDFILREIDK